jgi:hypothetical protein
MTVDANKAKNVSNSIFRVFNRLAEEVKLNVRYGTYDAYQSVLNAYKNTFGKMIIEYGKTVGPVYKAFGDLFEEVSVNGGCNVTCATFECFRPEYVDRADYYNILGFYRSCFEQDCGCKFNYEAKLKTTEGRKEIDEKIRKLDIAS